MPKPANRASRKGGSAQSPASVALRSPRTADPEISAAIAARRNAPPPPPEPPVTFGGLPVQSILQTPDGDVAGLAKALQHEALSTLVATMRSAAADPSERLRAAEQVSKWAEGYAPKVDPLRKHLAMTDDELLEFIKLAQSGMYEPAAAPSPSFEAMLAKQWEANEALEEGAEFRRACTCHPDDAPVPCQHKYALGECKAAADEYAVRDLL